MDIGTWLRNLQLSHYEQAFRDNDIGADILPELTAEDLVGLGVTSIGHRRKLLAAIAALRSEGLARDIAAEPQPSALPSEEPARAVAERRQLTVVFIDLVGSTALSARLDPEDMSKLLRAYQNAVIGGFARFEGHVAKLMGDGVLAYFGWPRAHEDEAERAVRASLTAVEAVGRLASPTGEPLAARVGIATGVVVVGDRIGEGAAQEEAVVGETPNLAARLETLAGPNEVVIGEGTRKLLGALFEVEDLGLQPLKGLTMPARAFRVLGPGRAASRFEALHVRELAPIVGRGEELALLLERWRRAKAGEGQVVLLSGEPGIGKSRIVLALREALAQEPVAVLNHFCSPYHMDSALFPVIGQLERAAGFAREDGPEQKLSKLETFLNPYADSLDEDARALMAALLSLPVENRAAPDLTPERQKQRTFEVLLQQFEALCSQQPVLAIYEDVHWIDPSTMELLDLLIERVQGLRALTVITFRPEFSPPWTGHAHVTFFSLSRLVRGDVAMIVGRVVGGKALPKDVLAQITSKTDGIPLFVEELTRTVLESGLLRDLGDHLELIGVPAELIIPSTLQDSLMARLDRLALAKELAQIGACIGREFDHDLLAAVSPLQEPTFGEALVRLVGSDLVFRRGQPPNATYTFKHALIQDVAYATLLKSRRVELHARIAATLEAQFPAVVERQPELLARHLSEAGIHDRAIDWWLLAGRLARQRSANKEAIGHLTRALAMLEDAPPSEVREHQELEVQVALGPPLIATEGFGAPQVETAYARAEELARRQGHESYRARALRGLCHVYHVRGHLTHAGELSAELLELVERGDDLVRQADAHHALGFNLFHLGQHGQALTHLEAARSKIERAGDPADAFAAGVNIHVHGRAYASHVNWHLGFADRAVVAISEAIEVARRLDHPFSLVVALAYASMLHQFRREPAMVREHADAAYAVCAEYGFSYYLAWATIMDGWACAEEGDLDRGIVRLRDGLRDLRATGAGLRVPHYLALLAELYVKTQQMEEAGATLAEADAVAERHGESWANARLRLLEGELSLATCRPAADCFRRAVEIAAAQGAVSLMLRAAIRLARHLRAEGKSAEAYNTLASPYASISEGFDTPDILEGRALLDELRSECPSGNR
ncbi:AAA family ATPase [Phyllobacterium brassicacearum]|uniref:AAA family ATPase n=1 Tax=Phyllobacterium brassicacearum TaxID=314235 RepID=UPI0010D4BD65|nr:AAA family ATPase [Phyllobacterium brassicacearum]TDQ16690.1 SAM (Sterile alpha motif) domain-containing protein [Phyllobacterium brassicacearum]